MALSRFLLLSVLSLCLCTRVWAADVTSVWNGGTGSWTEGTRWSTDPNFPENGAQSYDASISGFDSEVTLDRDLAIDTLNLDGAILRTDGVLTLGQGLHLSGSAITGSGSVAFGGTSTIENGVSIQGVSLVNEGAITWTSGSLASFGGGSLRNALGASLAFTNADQVELSGLDHVWNDGTLEKSGAGTTFIEAPFESSGSVVVHEGALFLDGGASTPGSSGSFQVDSPAQLLLTGNLLAGSQLTGAGGVKLWNGTVQGLIDLDGALTVRNMHIDSTGNHTGFLVIDSAAALGVELTGDLAVDGDLFWRNGTLTGPGALSIGGAIHMGGTSELTLDGRTLSNTSELDWTDTPLSLLNGAKLVNEVGGSMSIQNATLFAGDGTGEIVNHGHFYVAGGASLPAPFTNDGSISVDSGSLGLYRGLTSPGSIHIAAGAALQIGLTYAPTGAASIFAPGSVVDGLGDVIASDGEIEVSGSFAPGRLVVNGNQAHVRFTQPLSEFQPPLQLDAGEVRFEGGPIHIQENVVLGQFGRLALLNGSRISGDRTWGGAIGGSGAIDLDGKVEVSDASLDAVTLRNSERLTVGDQRQLRVENGAVLHNLPGAEILMSGQIVSFTRTGSVVNQGTIQVTPGIGFGAALPAVQNSGLIDLAADTGLGPYTQTAGKLLLHGVTVQTDGVSPLDIQGGVLAGTGLIGGNVASHATIAPGDTGATGQLYVNQVNLFDGSVLDFELGGAAPGQFDSLNVSRIFLDGEMSLRFIGGFETSVGESDSFELIHAFRSLQGVLDNVVDGARIFTADGIGSFAVHYGANSLVIDEFRAVPEPASLTLIALALLASTAAARSQGR